MRRLREAIKLIKTKVDTFSKFNKLSTFAKKNTIVINKIL